jgi:hypothetical protein
MQIKERFPYETVVIVESEEDEKKLQEFAASHSPVVKIPDEPRPKSVGELIYHTARKQRIFGTADIKAEYDALGLAHDGGPFDGEGLDQRVSSMLSYMVKTEKLTRPARGQYALLNVTDRFAGLSLDTKLAHREELDASRNVL